MMRILCHFQTRAASFLASLFIRRVGLALALALLPSVAPAQENIIPEGVFTVGATTLDDRGRPWAYVAVISPEEQTLEGRELAVYVKPAAADAPGDFTRQGVLTPATDKALAAAYLDRAARLGGDRDEISAQVLSLWRMARYPNYLASLHDPREPGDPPWPNDPPQPGEPVTGEQVAQVLARATTDAGFRNLLRLTSLGSPAFAMFQGRAWAGLLPVDVGQPVTIELRLREGGVDTGVIGRVALVAGQPLPLPPPGAPVQVPDLTPSGDLNIHLRWATPDELRRYSLLAMGYNVYRVAKNLVDASPEPLGTEDLLQYAETSPDEVKRLNQGAILPSKLFSEADVARFDAVTGGDAETLFFTDDNGRLERDGAGQVIGVPFEDCAEYYYFVTARDPLGRDGLASLAGLARAERRLAPQVPQFTKAEAEILPATDGAPQTYQVAVSWRPSAPTGAPVTRYELLRGIGGNLPDELKGKHPHQFPPTLPPLVTGRPDINNGALLEFQRPEYLVPFKQLRVETVTSGGATQLKLVDTSGGAPVERLFPADGPLTWTDTEPVNRPGSPVAGRTVWYAVRAVYESDCTRRISSPGPPSYAAFRAPEAPPLPASACYQGNNLPFGVAIVVSNQSLPGQAVDGEYRVIAQCVRSNDGVTSARFTLRGTLPGGTPYEEIRTVAFPEASMPGLDDTLVSEQFVITGVASFTNVTLGCTITTTTGQERTSSPASISAFNNAPGEGAASVQFASGGYSLAELPPAGPLLNSIRTSTTINTTATRIQGTNLVMAPVNFPVLPAFSPEVDQSALSVLLERNGVALGAGRLAAGKVVVRGDFTGPVTARLLGVYVTHGGDGCVHQRRAADNGIAPVTLALCLTPGTVEHRVYRTISDGEPRLIAQDESPYSTEPGAANQVFVVDDALPAVTGRVEYFGQLVNRDGNASPLFPLLECPITLVAPLPTPALSEPRPKYNAAGEACMELTWFCPPPGVERFKVFIEQQGSSFLYAQFLPLPAALAAHRTLALPIQPRSGPSFGPVLREIAHLGTLAESINLPQHALSLFSKGASTRQFYTPRVGPTGEGVEVIGSGPSFTLQVPIAKNLKYRVWLRAVGPTGGVSPASRAWDFTWRAPRLAPTAEDPQIDWPARELPPVYGGAAFNPPLRVNEEAFPPVSEGVPGFVWPDNSGGRYQRGVLIARKFVSEKDVFVRNVDPAQEGWTNGPGAPFQAVRLEANSPLLAEADINPNRWLASPADDPSSRALPAVLYRRQVPSEDYPEPAGDVIQVSPLIEHIAWERAAGFDTSAATIYDPFIGVVTEKQPNGDVGVHFYLLDTQPVIRGARYEYFLVRFAPNGEIKDIINAGTTDIL